MIFLPTKFHLLITIAKEYGISIGGSLATSAESTAPLMKSKALGS